MDPFTEQSEQLQQFSIDMTRGVFENGQEGIIAIDIQEMDFPSLTINLLLMKSMAEGNGLFEKDFVAQPDTEEKAKLGTV
jgi:hypothetical protein